MSPDSLQAVLREVWTRDMWMTRFSVVLVDADVRADPPHLVLRDPTRLEREGVFDRWDLTVPPPDRYTFHPLDLTEFFYGPERLFRSLDRQIADAGFRHPYV